MLLSACLLLALFNSYAQQPQAELLNTVWYLHHIYDSDQDEYFYVEGYQPYGGNPTIPQINPRVQIDDDLIFEGEGICNFFTGTLEFDPSTNSFRATEVFLTADSCGFFEDMIEGYLIGPFGYVESDPNLYTIVDPQLTNDPDGATTMTYLTQPFLEYTYRSVPVLGNADRDVPKVSLVPNPANELVSIQTGDSGQYRVLLFDMYGVLLSSGEFNGPNITLSLRGLATGVYLIKLVSTRQEQVLKLRKF